MQTCVRSSELILAIYREQPFRTLFLAETLTLIGLCVVISVYTMHMIALGFRKPPPDQVALSEETQDTMIMWLTTTSGILFTGSVIAFALLLFDVPFWPSTLVLLALVALLMGLLLWVRRTNKRRSRNIVRKED